MIRPVLFALSLVAICSRAATCETALAPISRSELRELAASAHAPAEFRRLANYYQHLSIRFAEQSREQERLWKRELEHPTLGQKYPAAGDCARRFARVLRGTGSHRSTKGLELRTATPGHEGYGPGRTYGSQVGRRADASAATISLFHQPSMTHQRVQAESFRAPQKHGAIRESLCLFDVSSR